MFSNECEVCRPRIRRLIANPSVVLIFSTSRDRRNNLANKSSLGILRTHNKCNILRHHNAPASKTVGRNPKAMPTVRYCLLCHYGVTLLHCQWEVATHSTPRLLQLLSPTPSHSPIQPYTRIPRDLK